MCTVGQKKGEPTKSFETVFLFVFVPVRVRPTLSGPMTTLIQKNNR